MDLRLLGRVEAWVGAEEIDLGPPQQRAVLATLALELNQVVSLDRLADIVWHGEPPRSARNALQVNVSRLRRLLAEHAASEVRATRAGPLRLTTRAPGYVLEGDPRAVDVHRFTAGLTAARAEPDDGRRAKVLREALELWRGPPLADLEPHVALRLCAGLEEARWSAVEECVDAELALWRHRELLTELADLVRVQPLRERLVGQYMTALYRSGRRGEALECFHRLRRQLADELGLDPGDAVRALHDAILRGDPALAATAPTRPAAVPAQLPADVAFFVGREQELATLDALGAGRSGAPVIAAVVGPAGVGKTGLVIHWAHRVAPAFPDGQLYLDLRGFGPGEPLPPEEGLVRLLRALGVAGDGIPPGLDERASMFRSLVAGRRLLVVLDNARSSAQVRPLLPGSAGCAVVITSRNRLDGLVALDGARTLPLDVLPPAPALELLGQVAGPDRVGAQRDDAGRLVELCGGLPLAVRIAAARLVGDPARPIADAVTELADDRRRLAALSVEGGDSAVRAVLAASYRALPAESARLFRLLGLFPGDRLDAGAAAALAALPIAEARRLLGALAADHLVLAADEKRFALHDLVRLYAAECVARDESSAARHTAFGGLLHWYAYVADLAERAMNTRRTPLPADGDYQPPDPVSFAKPAEAFDWLEAEHQNLLAAIREGRRQGFTRQLWRIANGMMTFCQRRFHVADWIETHRIAMDAAAAAGDKQIEALMANGLGIAYSYAGRTDDAVAAYEHALAIRRQLGAHRLVGITLLNLGVALYEAGRLAASAERLESSLAILRPLDRAAAGVCLSNLGLVLAKQDRFDLAEAHYQEALAIAVEHEHPHSICNVHEDLGDLKARTGREREAVGHYRHAIDVAREIGDRVVEARSTRGLGEVLLRLGEAAAGRDRLQEALALAAGMGSPLADEIAARLAALEAR